MDNRGAMSGPEAHPFYPLRAGLEWEYRTIIRHSGSELPPSKHRERISDLRVENGQIVATVTTEYEANKTAGITHRVLINRDGLSPDQTPMGTPSAMVQAVGVQGVLMPREPRPGQRWSYTLQFDSAQQIYKINATAEATSSVLVEVPAGRFDTARVFSTVKTRITTKTPFSLPGGIEQPTIEQSQVEESLWARGVGRVKMITRAATGYETIVELIWYSPG